MTSDGRSQRQHSLPPLPFIPASHQPQQGQQTGLYQSSVSIASASFLNPSSAGATSYPLSSGHQSRGKSIAIEPEAKMPKRPSYTASPNPPDPTLYNTSTYDYSVQQHASSPSPPAGSSTFLNSTLDNLKVRNVPSSASFSAPPSHSYIPSTRANDTTDVAKHNGPIALLLLTPLTFVLSCDMPSSLPLRLFLCGCLIAYAWNMAKPGDRGNGAADFFRGYDTLCALRMGCVLLSMVFVYVSVVLYNIKSNFAPENFENGEGITKSGRGLGRGMRVIALLTAQLVLWIMLLICLATWTTLQFKWLLHQSPTLARRFQRILQLTLPPISSAIAAYGLTSSSVASCYFTWGVDPVVPLFPIQLAFHSLLGIWLVGAASTMLDANEGEEAEPYKGKEYGNGCDISVVYGPYEVAGVGAVESSSVESEMSVLGTVLCSVILTLLEGELPDGSKKYYQVSSKSTKRGLILPSLNRSNWCASLLTGTVAILLLATFYAIFRRGSGLSIFGQLFGTGEVIKNQEESITHVYRNLKTAGAGPLEEGIGSKQSIIHDVGYNISHRRFYHWKTCWIDNCFNAKLSKFLSTSITRVPRGRAKRFKWRKNDWMFILRLSAALVVCTNDCHFIPRASAAPENSETWNSESHIINSEQKVARRLGRAVPARKRGFIQTARTANNLWWGSSGDPIFVDDDDDGWGSELLNSSKASKSSSKGAKSGEAKQVIPMPPQPVQQIIIYIPSPTRKPVTERLTMSPKPTALPTTSPTRHPSTSPTGSPSFVSTPYPSKFPIDPPSSRPTFHSSDHPSDRSSENPSFIPSIPPSQAPSLSSSSVPSVMPTNGITPSPTSSPESFISSTISPSAVGLKSVIPTVVLTSSPITSKTNKPIATAKPTKEAKTNKPSPYALDEASTPPTISASVNTTSPTPLSSSNIPTLKSTLVPTFATTPEATQTPTLMVTVVPTVVSNTSPTSNSPINASIPPTDIPSSISPVSLPSVSYIPTSTTDSIIDERQDLQMFLYGIDMLTSSLTTSFELETKKYIEDFYNTDIDPGSLLSTLKDSVNEVNATITVTDWTQPSTSTLTGNQRTVINETAEDKAKVIVLDVTEPCTGESPLIVMFSIKLEYFVDEPKLRRSDLIIAFPFRTVDFRTSYIEDYLRSGGQFNGLYCTSRIVFPGGTTPVPSYSITAAPINSDVTMSPTLTPTMTATTSVPTIGSTAVPSSASAQPTTDTIVDERKGLQMFLYGINLLTPSRTKSYEVETKNYIEDFYNINNTSGSLHSAMKGSIYGVSAAVKVTDWSQPVDPRLTDNHRIFPVRKIKQPNVTAEGRAKVIVLDVTEPCTGEPPLIVTFSLKLQYRVDDQKLSQSDLVISFPFGTIDFRTSYIRDYLQSGGEFNGLYCASQILFPSAKTPMPSSVLTAVPSSSGLSDTPTLPLSFLPTPKGTAVPTSATSETPTLATSAVNGTFIPTLDVTTLPTTASNGSTIPTLSVSLAPMLFSPSFTPSTLNGTLLPTLANVTENPSVIPTLGPSAFSGSVAPSILNASAAPSILNASAAPSILNASTAPSLVNASITPTLMPRNASAIPTPSSLILNASTAPSILNASFVPTSNFTSNATSLVPTVLFNGTSSPSAGNITLSFVPTASSVTESIAPTATLPPWEMRMYGMTDLTEPGQVLYNQRTALYIEDFYNGGSSEGIRGQISDMTAIVQVLGQVPPSPIRASSNTRTSIISFHSRKRKHKSNQSFTQGDVKRERFRRSRRFLQNNDCSGSFLTLRLKINITYSTLNDALTAEEVLQAPFSTAEYRDDYLNNYLDDGPDGGQFFGDLTCTSEILETSPKLKVPTPVPIESSTTPSITFGWNESSLPTIAVLSGDESKAPSLLNASIAPSASSPSAGPTSNSMKNQTSLIPTLFSNAIAPPFDGNTTDFLPTLSNITESIAPTSTKSGNLTAPSPAISGSSSIPTISSNITTPPPANRETDDIFNDSFKFTRSSPSYDRKCGKVDFDTHPNAEEIEIKFVYGVETKSHKYHIDDMENLILNFVTTSILRCAEGDLQPFIQPRLNNNILNFGVLRIRYPTDEEITTITQKCIATLSAAKGCFVLSTKLLITTTHSPVSEVHTGVLNVVKDAFTNSVFSESVSDMLCATYLGPDTSTFYASALGTDTHVDDSSEGNFAIAFMFSVTIVLAAAVWVCISSPLTRRELLEKICSARKRRTHYQSLYGSHTLKGGEEDIGSDNLAAYRDLDRDNDSQHSQSNHNLLQEVNN